MQDTGHGHQSPGWKSWVSLTHQPPQLYWLGTSSLALSVTILQLYANGRDKTFTCDAVGMRTSCQHTKPNQTKHPNLRRVTPNLLAATKPNCLVLAPQRWNKLPTDIRKSQTENSSVPIGKKNIYLYHLLPLIVALEVHSCTFGGGTHSRECTDCTSLWMKASAN